MSVCVPCVCRSLQRPGEGIGYPRFGVQEVVSHYMGAGNQTQVLCNSSKHSYPFKVLFLPAKNTIHRSCRWWPLGVPAIAAFPLAHCTGTEETQPGSVTSSLISTQVSDPGKPERHSLPSIWPHTQKAFVSLPHPSSLQHELLPSAVWSFVPSPQSPVAEKGQ